MKLLSIAYAGTLISFLLIDALWLGIVARSFYRNQLGDMMLPSPNLAAAAIFYLVFAIAVVILAVRPGLEAGSISAAFGYGAVLGLAAYGTYDMTNLSTLKGWPVQLTVVDLVWARSSRALRALAAMRQLAILHRRFRKRQSKTKPRGWEQHGFRDVSSDPGGVAMQYPDRRTPDAGRVGVTLPLRVDSRAKTFSLHCSQDWSP